MSDKKNYTPHGGEHKMGQGGSGYEVTKDGKYYPAPCVVDEFDRLFAEKQAVYNLLRSVETSAQAMLAGIELGITKAKKRLIENCGLDREKSWVYYGESQYLCEQKPEVEEVSQPSGKTAAGFVPEGKK